MQKRKGTAIVWVALFLFILVGIVGLSLDWGKSALNVHELHNGADASALAGAQMVKWDHEASRDLAVAIARENNAENKKVTVERNDLNAADGELVLGRWIRQSRTFYVTTQGANAVKVVGRRLGQRDDAPPLRLNWGPVFNTKTVAVARHAIALSIGSTGAGIICLAADPRWDPSMDGAGLLQGSCTLDLRGPDDMIGDIQVNAVSGDHPKYAVNIEGKSAKIYAGEMNVVGLTSPDADNVDAWEPLYGENIPFSVNTDMPRVEDPLLSLNDTPPDLGSMTSYPSPDVSGGQTVTIQPGWYPGGLNPEGGTIIMEPGTYAVGGGTRRNQPTGLVFNGGTLTGEGVTVYVTGDPDGSKTGTAVYYGEVDIGAQGTANLVSPGDADPTLGVDGLPGVVVWQDINNHNEATILGGLRSELQGTLYFPDCLLHLGGGPKQLGTQVLAGALRVHGDVTLHVAYDGRNMVKAYRSMLVE